MWKNHFIVREISNKSRSAEETTRLFVPSFISTLAVGGVAFSIAQWLSGQRALNMDAAQRNETFGWMIGRTFGVPNELLIAAVLSVIGLAIVAWWNWPEPKPEAEE